MMRGSADRDGVLRRRLGMGSVEVDASGLETKELNDRLRDLMHAGVEMVVLRNVCGQRYIGTRLYSSDHHRMEIEIFGTPGNDLGAFLSGHRLRIHGNAQDGVGNTMDDGEIVIEGRAGDVLGMSMRGGNIFVRESVGYRTALHMKEYLEKRPVLVIGGTSQDFLGEYMAGGIVILLGLGGKPHLANFIGSGMHGGVIYLRGKVEMSQVGKDVEISGLDEEDQAILERYIGEFLDRFPELGLEKEEILGGEFVKLSPVSKRPYGKLYAY
jgi:glutamate synthase domain-containing protein 3